MDRSNAAKHRLRRRGRFAASVGLIVLGVASGALFLTLNLEGTHASEQLSLRGGGAAESSDADHSRLVKSEEEQTLPSREECMGSSSMQSARLQLGAMPAVFVENAGQWAPEVKFGARCRGNFAAFTDRGITFSTRVNVDQETGSHTWQSVALNFFEPESAGKPSGEKKLKGVHNYLIGNDASKWRTGVALYEAVRYDEVVPGVSMIVTERGGKLEYDLHVAAGADVGAVDVECEGAESIAIDEAGALRIATKDAVLCQLPPVAWYELGDGERKVADCRFRLTSPSSFGFEVKDLDRSCKLVVDPGLVWSTYLGGDGHDAVTGIDFVADQVTVVGYTDSVTFPTTANAPIGTYVGGTYDAFATRLDPSQSGNSQLVWSTFIGGSGLDKANGVALSSNGNVAICGETNSSNFPVTQYASQSTAVSSDNAFVCYLNPNLISSLQLRYSSYYGATATETGYTVATAIAIESTPTITIVGYTSASSLKLSATPYDATYGGTFEDACVAQFNPFATSSASSLIYSSYIGTDPANPSSTLASEQDRALCVALGPSYVYIGGSTKSKDFHSVNYINTIIGPYQPTNGALTSGFLMKLKPNDLSQQLWYATYLGAPSGGISATHILGLTTLQGVFYASGWTTSSSFPMSVGGITDEAAAFDNVFGNNGAGMKDDAIIVKLDPSSSNQLRYSTFFGGQGVDRAHSLQRVADKCVVFVGMTQSNDLPVSSAPTGWAPYDSTLGGTQDAFLARLRWSPLAGQPRLGAAQLDYSTYLGGATTVAGGGLDAETAYSVVLDGLDTYFGGETNATDYPTAGNPYDAVFNGAPFQFDGIVGNLQLPPFSN